MSEPAQRRATYDDLLAVPEGIVAELIGGELVTQPRPRGAHVRAASALGFDLGGPFDRGRDGPGGWWILDEPELHLGADVLVPDLAGYRRERLPHLPEGHAFVVTPDWVCELLSPSTARRDRLQKMRIYAQAGVRHAWLVDPALATLEVYRLEGTHWLLLGTYGSEDSVRAEPFDAIELSLGPIFAC